MERPKPDETADRAFTVKVTAGVIAIAVAIWAVTFLVLPVIDVRNAGIDSWTAICRAIGIGSPSPPSSPSAPTVPVSKVAWTDLTMDLLAAGDSTRGEAMAQETCQACHIPNGLTADPETIPSITGLSPRALFKQLRDMRDGQRPSDVMSPMIADMTDRQFADVVAYYGSLPMRNSHLRNLKEPTAAAMTLATKGDTARALPACDSCHAATAGGPLEAPTLTGQYPVYVAAQLKAYAGASRNNDIYGRMRGVAQKLTDSEIADLAAYYNAPQ
ncbi:MAG: c-type cytochrome [Rhodospirillaceae bacterium]|nr:c-type cytochrome [Rhodospirillaceae bacterium]